MHTRGLPSRTFALVSISVTSTTTSPALPLRLEGVSRVFANRDGRLGETRVLHDITLDVEAGEIIALLGASGCGKSTLLRGIGGLDRPTTGTVAIGDAAVEQFDERSAIAFQEPRLLPWRSVERNVELGLPRGTVRSAGRARVRELLELVQLDHARTLRPREISGGMAQRASLARALARGPGVLLLDEPFGALDALTRLQMQDLLLDIHAVEPATVVFVTHDVDEALYLADRVVLLGTDDSLGPRSGSTIRKIVTVPGSRPRDRAAVTLAELRADLLEGLGVQSHHNH